MSMAVRLAPSETACVCQPPSTEATRVPTGNAGFFEATTLPDAAP